MPHRNPRRGQSLVEFALVAMVTYVLLAAILTFGQLFFTAQVVQSAANTLAREISVAELAEVEDDTDPDYLGSIEDVVNKRKLPDVFDPDLLIFDLALVEPGLTLRQHIDKNWPSVNKILSVVMINDGDYLRYPGATIVSTEDGDRYFIAQAVDGKFTEWIPIVEDFSGDKFRFTPDPATGGIVAARINYPFHSVSFSAMKKSDDILVPNIGNYFEVSPKLDDPENEEANEDREYFESGESPEYLDPRTELYGGEFGLGRQYAWGKQVRPYRHILSGQAVYRREVFVP